MTGGPPSRRVLPTSIVDTPVGTILSRRIGKTSVDSLPMTGENDLEALGVFTEPQRRRVYEQLHAEGAATVSELVQALGMGRTLVAFHLSKLLEAGFVEVVAPEQVVGAPGRPAQ